MNDVHVFIFYNKEKKVGMEPNGMRVKDPSHYPTLQYIQGVYHDKEVFTAS